MYDLCEDDTTDAHSGLVDNSKEDRIPVMVTGFDLQVSTPEVNDNYVNY